MSHSQNQYSLAVPAGDAATMSSVEIAELCEKRHDHVMRDIKAMLEALEITAPKFGGWYKGGNRKELPCYNLPRDLTMTLVTGYSIPLRKRVIDRLDELERRQVSDPAAVLNDPAAMRGLSHLATLIKPPLSLV
jgi:phage regulator Rha-like protein